MCSTAVCPGMSDSCLRLYPLRLVSQLFGAGKFWRPGLQFPAGPTLFPQSCFAWLRGLLWGGGVYLRTFLSLGGLDGDQSPSSGPGLLVGGDAQGRAVSPFRWAGGGQGCFSPVNRVSKEGPGLQTLPELLRTGCCLFLTLGACRAEAMPMGWLPCVSHLSLPLS